MAKDVLADYRAGTALSPEESDLLAAMAEDEAGRELLRQYEAASVVVQRVSDGEAVFVFQDSDKDAVLQVRNGIKAVAEQHYQVGRYRLALGGFSIGLRFELVALSEDHPDTFASLHAIADCLYFSGQYEQALEWYEEAYGHRKEVLGPDDLDTLQSLHNLARCLWSLGRNEEAVEKCMEVYERRRAALGENHIDTLRSHQNVPLFLMALGRYEEALEHYEVVNSRCRAALGEDDPLTLLSLDNSARCLWSLGRNKEALARCEALYAHRQAALGIEHLATLASLHNLALCLQNLGRYKEALARFEALSERYRAVLGVDHPATLASLHNLALCLQDLGRYKEALARFEALSERYQAVLGIEHPETLVSLHSLALCTQNLGRYEEARRRFEALSVSRRAALGAEHPATLASLANLALCLQDLGRYKEALARFEALSERYREVLGAEHPETLASLHYLAGCLRELGRYEEALARFEALSERYREVLGAEHPATLASLANLALCLQDLGRYEEALARFEALSERYREVLGAEHPVTLASLHNLAVCLQSLDRYEEALTRFEALSERRRAVLDAEHPATLASLHYLALCLRKLGRYGEALTRFEALGERYQAVLGAEHPATLASFANLALCLRKLGRYEEALARFKALSERYQAVLGAEHPAMLASLANLALCLQNLGRYEKALARFEALSRRYRAVLGVQHPDTLGSLHNLALCLQVLGRDREALNTFQKVAALLTKLPQPGGLWLTLTGSTSNALARHARSGDFKDWPLTFEQLGQTLRTVLDLKEPEQLDVARSTVARFHAIYLGLCLDLDRPDLVPAALAAIQGRKLAALMLDELEKEAEKTPTQDFLRACFQAVRVELRRLALGLRVLSSEERAPLGGHERTAEAEVAAQRQRLETYRERLTEYRRLRTRLEQEDPAFGAASAALAPTLPELQEKLATGEGLVLLIHRRDTEQNALLAMVITRDSYQLVPLAAGLLTTTEQAQLYGIPRNSRAGMRLADSESPPPGELVSLDDLKAHLNDEFWQPLAQSLAGLQRLHLVSHTELHLLPYDLGCPSGLELCSYPGLVYYYLLRHQRSSQALLPDPANALGLHVHDAQETPWPIPLVHAERNIVSRLWPGPVYPTLDLATPEPQAHCLQLAGHGDHDENDPTLAKLQLGPGQYLDFQKILASPQRPSIVLLSACTVGRTTEDPDGDPLGLMGAFFLRGADYIIASLQPVPDFYIPLLVALFYQGWIQSHHSPGAALEEAKRRLREGDWYPDTEAVVRDSYRPVLEDWLKSCVEQENDHELANTTWSWPYPHGYYLCIDPETQPHVLADLKEELRDANGRKVIVEGILDNVCANRHDLPVEDLCVWVRGFGRPE